MKYLLFVILLIAVLTTTGCVNGSQNAVGTATPQIIYVTVLVTPTQTQTSLQNSNSNGMSFSDNKNSFNAQLDKITVEEDYGNMYKITVFTTVKNTGNKIVNLNSYGKITDWAGSQQGNSIGTFYGTIYPGESMSANEWFISISQKGYIELKKGATLTLEFRSLDPNDFHQKSYKTTMDVDFNGIPITKLSSAITASQNNPKVNLDPCGGYATGWGNKC
jgi:hypothetical protein